MGDDLGSDDEYLTGGLVVDGDDSDDDNNFDLGGNQKKKNKKGSVLEASTVPVINDFDDDQGGGGGGRKRKTTKDGSDNNTGVSNSNKKSKRGGGPKNREQLLLRAGRSIEQESAQNQSSFLWTALVHHYKMTSGKSGGDANSGDNNSDDEDSDDEDLQQKLQPKLQPFHFIVPTSNNNNTNDFASRLRQCLPSMKQLKTWKFTKSPLAIIVCLSARRAVQILKELKPLKTRTAKLFAKHLTVSEQTEWLQQTPFGLAVGTPHRLNVLCQSNALHLRATRLVILDSHQDAKGFTVCTLKDTASHCMEFIQDQCLPALKERPKQIKIAFC